MSTKGTFEDYRFFHRPDALPDALLVLVSKYQRSAIIT